MKPNTDQLCELFAQVKDGRVGRYALQELIHNAPLIAAQRGLRESIFAARNAAVKQNGSFPRCQSYLRIAEITHNAKDLVSARNATEGADEINMRGGKWEALALVAEAYAKAGHFSVARDIAESIKEPRFLPYCFIAYGKIACESKDNRDLKKAQAGLKLLTPPCDYRDELLEEIAITLAHLEKGDAGRQTARLIVCPKRRAFTLERMSAIKLHVNDPDEMFNTAKLIAETPTTDKDNTLSLLARNLADDNSRGTAGRVLEFIADEATLASTLAYIAPKICFPMTYTAKAREIAEGLTFTDSEPIQLYRFGSTWCAIAKATEGAYGVRQTQEAIDKFGKFFVPGRINDPNVRDFLDTLRVEYAEFRAMIGDIEGALQTAGEITNLACDRAYTAIAKVCQEFISKPGKEPSY